MTLKIKTVKFEVKTRAQSLRFHTSEIGPIFNAARDLLKTEMKTASSRPLKLRLMGKVFLCLLQFRLMGNVSVTPPLPWVRFVSWIMHFFVLLNLVSWILMCSFIPKK